MSLPEAEWTYLRSLHDLALDRFCARVLDECAAVIADGTLTHHQRYLRLFEILQERDRSLSDAFDGARRSNAILSLMHIQRLQLLTPDEMAGFSAETLRAIQPPAWSRP